MSVQEGNHQRGSANSIGVVVLYFGQFPEWADLFFETLKRNDSIDFIFFTDCDVRAYEAPNLVFHQMSFQDYIKLVNQRLDFEFEPVNAYKLCDLRPLLGFIHQEVFASYDFFGWTDTDILFGDIRSFYSDQILNRHDVISTHVHRIAGHLALFRNTRRHRMMFRKIDRWKAALRSGRHVGMDERGLADAYTHTAIERYNIKHEKQHRNAITRLLSARKKRRLYMEEQCTTPFASIPWTDGTRYSDHAEKWYYVDGEITNNRNGSRKFIYLHLMNFKSSRWRHDGTPAPWEGRGKICFAGAEHMKEGVRINSDGIFPI